MYINICFHYADPSLKVEHMDMENLPLGRIEFH